jgi:hypothetical protein
MNGERIGARPPACAGTRQPRAHRDRQALAEARWPWPSGSTARAPNSLASIKELLTTPAAPRCTSQLGSERDHFVRNLHHPNAGIGIAAFLDRPKPDARYELARG